MHLVFGGVGGALLWRYFQARPLVQRAFRVAARDGHRTTRLVRVGFGVVVAIMRMTGGMVAWLDRRSGSLRIIAEQRIALGPHTPGLTPPRTDQEAIDELIAPVQSGLDKEDSAW